MTTLLKATACVIVAGNNAGIEPESDFLWNEFATPRRLEGEGEMELKAPSDAKKDEANEEDNNDDEENAEPSDEQNLATKENDADNEGLQFGETFSELVNTQPMGLKAAGAAAILLLGLMMYTGYVFGNLAMLTGMGVLEIAGFGAVWFLLFAVLKQYLPLEFPFATGLLSFAIPALLLFGWSVMKKKEATGWLDHTWPHGQLIIYGVMAAVLMMAEYGYAAMMMEPEQGEEQPKEEDSEDNNEDDQNEKTQDSEENKDDSKDNEDEK